jgi:hypothetical protein
MTDVIPSEVEESPELSFAPRTRDPDLLRSE